MLEEISFIEPMVEQDTFDDLSGEILIQFISELPNGCREVFNLFVIDELSHNEISNLLHITTGSSKSQLSYARKLLQDKIKSSNHIFQL
jgi:RNA polymerase sigma-70 factor (ECF subfamily)